MAALGVAVVAALSVAAGIAADRGPEGVKIPPTALLPDLDPSAPVRLEARIATVDGSAGPGSPSRPQPRTWARVRW